MKFPEFTNTTEIITPELAEEYLLKTDHNPRRRMPTVVAKYARDIEAGNWHLGAGFLAFDQCGCLVQGQHTCAGVMTAGEPVRMAVFRGLTPEAVRALDTGKKRTNGEVLTAEGYQNGNAVASAIRTLWRWERGVLTSSSSLAPTLDEAMEYLKLHPTIADAVRAAKPVSLKPLRFRISVSGPLYVAASILAPDDVDEFFIRLDSGSDLSPDSPILLLRNWLLADAGRKGATRSGNVVHALAIKAWNAWITGTPIKMLKWTRGGKSREEFPEMVGPDGEVWPTAPHPGEKMPA